MSMGMSIGISKVGKKAFLWQTKETMAGIVKNILGHLDPEQLKNLFYIGQVAFGAVVVFAVWYLNRNKSESVFKVREADIKKPAQPGAKGAIPGQNKGPGQVHDLASARIQRQEVLSLSGIRIDAAPHEILGVPARASEDQIQVAYRELIKRYHPDRVGRPGSREWNDAQKIADAIINARKKMLETLKNRS
jgi:hypothetical protein